MKLDARLLTLIAFVACSTTRPAAVTSARPNANANPVDSPEKTLAEIADAATAHDLARLEKLRTRIGAADDKSRVALANGIYWTAGPERAKGDLAAVCKDDRLPAGSVDRDNACARLTFADHAPLNQLRSAGQGALLDKQKLLIAMISIAGNPPEPFIIDTGAPTTVISRRYADRIKLPYDTGHVVRSSDAGGHGANLAPAMLTQVKWGEIDIENVPAFVLELPENFHVGGILAPQDVFRGLSFEIDGPARAVRILEKPAAPAEARTADILWNGGNLFVQAAANDLPALPFLFDSGAGGNGLCAETLQKYGKSVDGGTDGESSGAVGQIKVQTGIAGTISVAGEPARATTLFVQSCISGGDGVERSGYVGAPWFLERRVIFDSAHAHVRFTVPTGGP